MKSYALFAAMPPDVAEKILHFFREMDRDVYKSSIAALAQSRNLRPVFVMKKPRDQQIAWLHKTLKLRTSEEMAENLLQVWLMKERADMLTAFLEGLGIEHDGEGSIEGDLPEQLDAQKLKTTVDTLCDTYAPGEVAVYLQVFQSQTENGWPELAELLASDERLALDATP